LGTSLYRQKIALVLTAKLTTAKNAKMYKNLTLTEINIDILYDLVIFSLCVVKNLKLAYRLATVVSLDCSVDWGLMLSHMGVKIGTFFSDWSVARGLLFSHIGGQPFLSLE